MYAACGLDMCLFIICVYFLIHYYEVFQQGEHELHRHGKNQY